MISLICRIWSESEVKVPQSCPTLCNPMDYTVHVILQARILERVAFPFSRGSSQPRDQPRSPALQVGSLPAEPWGKPKNTGVGSLSLLQRIFPTQESNQGLLHCRWILYQLSYEGSTIWSMIQMTLFTKQNWTHRHRKKICGYQKGKVEGWDKLGVWD